MKSDLQSQPPERTGRKQKKTQRRLAKTRTARLTMISSGRWWYAEPAVLAHRPKESGLWLLDRTVLFICVCVT